MLPSTQYITLAFVGGISITSLRGFLRNMRKAFAAVSGSGSGAGMLLVLTELTGLYAISTILLIRKQLPPKYRCGHMRQSNLPVYPCMAFACSPPTSPTLTAPLSFTLLIAVLRCYWLAFLLVPEMHDSGFRAGRQSCAPLHAHSQKPCKCNACRSIITDVLGGELEFEFFHAWFNTIFLAAALATLALFYAQHRRDRDPDLPLYQARRD